MAEYEFDPSDNTTYAYDSEDYYQYIFELFKEKVFPRPYEYVIIVIYGLVFLLAIFGNTLVCIAVLRNEHMRTVTNYYIVNLAVADILVTIFCLPVTAIVDVSETWFFGEVFCSVIPYIQNTAVCVSVFTLTMIAVDRYLAICRPLRFQISSKRTVITVILIWCLSLATMLPHTLTFGISPTIPDGTLTAKPLWLTKCADIKWLTSPWRKVYFLVTLLFTYLLPLAVIGVAYCMVCFRLWSGIPSDETSGRSTAKKASSNNNVTGNGKGRSATEAQLQSRRKVARMLIVVVVIFAVCYLPIRTINVLNVFGVFSAARNVDMLVNGQKMGVAYLIAHIMAFLNSAINPVIYNFMSAKFRQAFKMAFACCLPASMRGQARHPNRYGYKCQSFVHSTAMNTECFAMSNRQNSATTRVSDA